MYQTFNGNISQKTDKDFIKLSSVHKHYTRHTINKFHLPRVNTCFGHKVLSFAGVKLRRFKVLAGCPLKNISKENFWQSMMIRACS